MSRCGDGGKRDRKIALASPRAATYRQVEEEEEVDLMDLGDSSLRHGMI